MNMEHIDDIFNDDSFLEPDISNPIEESDTFVQDDDFLTEGPENKLLIDPVINELLKAKGITDGKIKIIDEDDKEQEIYFSNLTTEEQLEILNDADNSSNFSLNDAELAFINSIRKNKVSIEQYLENYKQSIIDSIPESQGLDYDIDSYDDHELFILDLKNKYDLTDDELVKELEKELKDEALFKKKVDILRNEYKKLEDQYTETQRLESEAKQQKEYQDFAQGMVDIAINTPEFYGIELEDNEKEEVLSFLLDLDEQGTSKFSKVINDPKKLYEAA